MSTLGIRGHMLLLLLLLQRQVPCSLVLSIMAAQPETSIAAGCLHLLPQLAVVQRMIRITQDVALTKALQQAAPHVTHLVSMLCHQAPKPATALQRQYSSTRVG